MPNHSAAYYEQHQQEELLNLYGCFDGNTRELINFLRQHPEVQHLNLAYNKLDQRLGVPLLTALATDTTLASIDLYGNLLDDVCITAFAKALMENESVREISLIDNEIGPQGCAALAAVLHQNKQLTVLNLYCNKIGKQGSQTLFDSLAANTNLRVINIGNNAITDAGGEAVRTYLRGISNVKSSSGDAQTQRLQRIDLSDNELTAALKMTLVAEASIQGVVVGV